VANPFDIAKHINSKSDLEFDIKEYIPWMTNKIFSNTLDTVFFAEVMNMNYSLDSDIQYSFMFNAIPKANRFGRYNKSSGINNDVNLIMQKYQVNQNTAESYLKVMNDTAIKKLQEEMIEGGK